MTFFTTLLLIIGGLAVFSIITALIVVIFKGIKEAVDSPIDINLNAFTDKTGRAIFVEKKREIGASGRLIITGEPKDIDFNKMEKEKLQLEDVKVIVSPEQIINIGKGDWSKDKNINIINVLNAEDMPEALKNTVFGKILASLAEDRQTIKTIEEIIRKGSDLKTQYLHDMPDGEVSEGKMAQMEDILKHITEIIKDRKEAPHYSDLRKVM